MTGKTLSVSLEEFVWIWNQTQNFSLPKHHRIICKWLQERFCGENKRALLMAFRNSGKSTLVGLFCAFALFKDCNQRILIMAADYELAKKMVRNIKRIIEKHPLTRHLLPKAKDQWASDRFTVNRTKELRDPSVLARGLGANITGSRADIIVCDDVEVPKTCDTPMKRKELRARLAELDFVLVPEGMVLYVGTPHTFYTIYQIKKGTKENPAFLAGFNCLKLPLVNKGGKSAWPERFPAAEIKALQRRAGPNKFASQMMLEPVNISDSRLCPDALRRYKDELVYKEANGKAILTIGGRQMVSVSCWWDPAYGSASGDGSVVACVFGDNDGHYFLHRIKYIKAENAREDNASAQCQEVIDFIVANHIPSLRLETNGIGKFLPGILRREMRRRGVRCALSEVVSRRNKEQRIIEAFDAVLAERALYVHESVEETPFVAEMREWIPGGKGHDDGLDAVAGCLLAEPVRMNAEGAQNTIKARVDWRPAGLDFNGSADFAV
ncbi:MAG: phage terminase large subunit [Alphaproteobacteria bacterium]|nr:phage terminase large subunit [Alphaproteobacteria bacterium]